MSEVNVAIQELNSLQTQIRRWRIGGLLTILVVVLGCILFVRQQTLALVNDGPTHDAFLGQLKVGVARDVVPEVKTLTIRTIDRLGPVVRKEATKLELRAPQFVKRAEVEMNLLQQHLPERAERALQPSIGRVLEKQLATWQKQYPNLTHDQFDAARERLKDEVDNRIANVVSMVTLPYEVCLDNFLDDLTVIRKLETGRDDIDPEDLAIVSLGLLHDELLKISPEAQQLSATSTVKHQTKKGSK